MRYFVATMLMVEPGGFAVCSVERKGR